MTMGQAGKRTIIIIMLIYHQDFRKPTRLKALTNKCREHRNYTSDMFYSSARCIE